MGGWLTATRRRGCSWPHHGPSGAQARRLTFRRKNRESVTVTLIGFDEEKPN